METIELSLEIALKAYAGKKDKAGKAYILHPLRIMARMQTEEEMAVALLHDVIEDSDYTTEALLAAGVPPEVVEAVALLTKSEGEDYDRFIDRLSGNRLASKVKIADIEDNINVLRLASLSERDLERVVKYHRSWRRLNGAPA